MSRAGSGVMRRENSIQVAFMWRKQRCRETVTDAGKVLPPTAANIKYAHRLRDRILREIRLGTFVMADFFPESPRATIKGESTATLGEFCSQWLATKGRLAKHTRNQYRNACAIWCDLLDGEKPISDMTHGYVAAKIGQHPWASNKLLNNYLICLRGVFRLAKRELKLDDVATDGIENGKHQKPTPDPLSVDESAAVIVDMRKHYSIPIWAYFLFAFATGMRPEELIALQWSDVDWNAKTIRVERARTAGETKPVKTYQVRDVDLEDDAMEALRAMKPHTFMRDAEIFLNPVTDRPWHDERSQRDHYWKPSLKRCGIRARPAYNTRHTYATINLMNDVNVSYVSRQLGHKNPKMTWEVYFKWLEGDDKGRQRAKVRAAQALRRTSDARR